MLFRSKTAETVACEVLRELERIAYEGVKGELRITMNPEVAEQLGQKMEKHLEWVRGRYGLDVSVLADARFHHEQFEILEL